MTETTFDELMALVKKQPKADDYFVALSPLVWHGFWHVKRVVPFLRWLGHRLKNKKIYWLGFQVEWIAGVKEWR